MSMYAEYLHGQMEYEEFIMYANIEDRKDRYFLEHQFDERCKDEEGNEEEEE